MYNIIKDIINRLAIRAFVRRSVNESNYKGKYKVNIKYKANNSYNVYVTYNYGGLDESNAKDKGK